MYMCIDVYVCTHRLIWVKYAAHIGYIYVCSVIGLYADMLIYVC